MHWHQPGIRLGGLHVLPEHLAVPVVAAILIVRRPQPLLQAFSNRVVRLLGLLILWNLAVSLLKSPSVVESLEVVAWLTADLVLASVLIAAGDRARVVRHMLMAAVASALLAVAALLGAYLGITTWGVRPGESGTTVVYGLAFEANILAFFMVIATLLLVTQAERAGGAYVAAMVLFTSVVVATQTRAAILALCAGLTYLVVFGAKRDRLRSLLLIALCASLGLATLAARPELLAPLTAKATQALDAGTGQYRLASWQQALHDLGGLEDHAFGFGTNSYPQRSFARARLAAGEIPVYQANLFLQILYDTGVIGITIFLLVCWRLFRRIPRIHRPGAVATAVAYGVTAIFTSPFWFGYTWVLIAWWYLLGQRAPNDHS